MKPLLKSIIGLLMPLLFGSCANSSKPAQSAEASAVSVRSIPSHIEKILVSAPGSTPVVARDLENQLRAKGWPCVSDANSADARLEVIFLVDSGVLNNDPKFGPMVGLALLPGVLAWDITQGMLLGRVKDRNRYGAGGTAKAKLLECGTSDELWSNQAEILIETNKWDASAAKGNVIRDLIPRVMAPFPRADQ